MTNTTTDQTVPVTTERLSAKAWLYIVAAIGVGMLIGMELVSAPLKQQANDWKEMAGDWKKQALEYKAQSEQNDSYAARWQENANKIFAASQRCIDLVDHYQGSTK